MVFETHQLKKITTLNPIVKQGWRSAVPTLPVTLIFDIEISYIFIYVMCTKFKKMHWMLEWLGLFYLAFTSRT